MAIAHRVVDLLVRHLVGHVAERAHRAEIDAVLHRRIGKQDPEDGGARDFGVHRHQLAVSIDPGFDAHDARRAIEVMLHVFLARPHHLDRHARHRLGDRHAEANEVLRCAAATEASAQHHLVHLDFLERQLGGLRGDRHRRLAVLDDRRSLWPRPVEGRLLRQRRLRLADQLRLPAGDPRPARRGSFAGRWSEHTRDAICPIFQCNFLGPDIRRALVPFLT